VRGRGNRGHSQPLWDTRQVRRRNRVGSGYSVCFPAWRLWKVGGHRIALKGRNRSGTDVDAERSLKAKYNR